MHSLVNTVFLFSGQGSHGYHLGRALHEHDPVFRAALTRLDTVARAYAGRSVLDELYDPARSAHTPMADLRLSHPAIFMVEVALAQSLMEAGVRPDAVVGASLGAFAAATVAGCLAPEAALEAVLAKAEVMEAHCAPGTMIAVMAAPERYLDAPLRDLCELAAVNFAGHSVVALPETHRERVEGLLRARQLVFQRLDVPYAFHSRWVDPAGAAYTAWLRRLELRPPRMPFVCCAAGHALDTLPADYFWTVARAPIRFDRALAWLERQGRHDYVDLGPGGTLATFIKYGLPAGSASRIHTVMSPAGRDVDHRAAVVRQLGRPPAPPSIREHRTMKAIIFPGQGAQFKGMGKDVFPRYPELVTAASDILGYSITALCLDDPAGQLAKTQYTQPALFVVNALHYLQHQERHGESARPDFVAGHSLGEYNALLAAGVFSFETGVRLVKKRGELMGAARDGGMAAVIGGSADGVRAILAAEGLDGVDVANYNAPSQTVIAGPKEALARAEAAFSAQGLRCVILNVSAAFHSRFMQPAQAEFARFLEQCTFAAPRIPVIANVTARPYDPAEIAATLVRQIASPVRWVDSVRYLMGQGVDAFDEIGGSVLTRMVQEIRARETPLTDAPEPAPAAPAPASGAVPVPPVPTTAPHAGIRAERLGSPVFRQRYGVKLAYLAGAMYRGVASADLVIRMGRAGLLGFFGAGGLSPAKIETALVRIREALPAGAPWGMNLLANYEYPAQEDEVVDLYLKHGVRTVEAAAFMQMTPALVRFRALGLRAGPRGEVLCEHRIIAKVSRPEVAQAFMSPAPAAILTRLLEGGRITPEQAALAQRVPVASDVCVEADSGGHTDGGIAAVMLPPLLALRDELQRNHGYAEPVCMGLAGGIGGPEAAAAAFLLGADFILTGSINQCTVEAGMSADGKALLQEMDIHDTDYAPAGDMFEIGAQVQVLKRSVFFPSRANKLLSLYRHHNSLDEIPERTRRQLEGSYFKRSFDDIWRETQAYFRDHKLDHEIVKAEANPKHKMALVFRWYFAYCTRIAMEGTGDDRVNYQIQTGPALGSFNRWVKGTPLQPWTARHVDEIGLKLMHATAEHLTASFARFMNP